METEAQTGWDFFDSADFPADGADDPLDRAPVRHVVTAVVVGHNGAAWLPRLTEALWALERRPDRLIAVDTGSTDETSQLLGSLPGVEPVVGLSARTGFGTAVAKGLDAVGFAAIPSAVGPYGNDENTPVREWLWLLHDDCAPAPKALEQLLLAATITPEIGIWGPKLRLWPRDRELLEVGVTTSLGGRRDTGIEPGEYDQGQHDKMRDVLAVSSAGMLVSREVWALLKGFDPRLSMFRDDIDFGWRAGRAGYRVAVAPDAVVYHAQAAATGERPLAGTRRHAYQLDRAHAYYTVLANAPGKFLPLLILRFLVGTVLRSVWFVIGKTPSGAVDEWAALLGTLLAGGWTTARKERQLLAKQPHDGVQHLFARSMHAVRHNLEETGSAITERLRDAWADESEEQVVTTARRARTTSRIAVDQPRWRRQLIRRPFLVGWVLLLVGSLIAARGVFGSGVLRSAVMPPPHDNLGDLWGAAASAPDGVTPPAWLGQFSAWAVVTFGSPSLATDLIVLGAVPLAGLTAWIFLRRLVVDRLARAWGATAYGLSVFVGGAVSQGRIGSCVAAVVLPLLAVAIHTVAWRRRVALQGNWRSAWFAGICLAVLLAFTPSLGVLATAGAAAGGLVTRGWSRQSRQLLFSAGLGLVLVLPWTIELALHPSRLGQEAGGAPTAAIGPGDSIPHLLTGIPEGAPVHWLFGVPLVLVAVLSMVRETRNKVELLGWAAALAGLLGTLVSSRLGGGSGPLMFLMTAGWIGVVTVTWESVGRSADLIVRGVLAVVLFTTLVTAGWWMIRGDDGPLRRAPAQELPAYLVSAQEPPQNASILVVRKESDSGIRYTVVRGGPRMGAVEAEAPARLSKPITEVLSALGGGGAGDEAKRLAELDIDYVYLAGPVDPGLVATMDSVPGLNRSSAADGAAAWAVDIKADGVSPIRDVVHNFWRILGIIGWLLALVFCLPTARRAVAGTHARRTP